MSKRKEDSSLMSKGRGRAVAARGSKKAVRKRLIRESGNIFLNGLVFRNPVALGALGLFPVVGAGYSMENAAALSFMMLFMMLPVCLICGWLRMPVWVRPAVALVLSGLMYLPAAALLEHFAPRTFSGLGIYGILMIGNSIVLSRANDYAPTHITLAVVMDSLGCTAGFSAVIFAVAMLREIWSSLIARMTGTVQAGAYPFIGFLLLGILAALIQHWNQKRNAERKAKI
ncbi:Rnf-Nqr domain containing protein [Clostridium minihomine]|uniref:Rnf-Nqr domain containing protein n=1 Tax=Clostridium minihomine TaxID=2045012 RepID=UPI000C77E185|nr:Rnf-Nqr domain containing protein [Clostridium minihomine]